MSMLKGCTLIVCLWSNSVWRDLDQYYNPFSFPLSLPPHIIIPHPWLSTYTQNTQYMPHKIRFRGEIKKCLLLSLFLSTNTKLMFWISCSSEIVYLQKIKWCSTELQRVNLHCFELSIYAVWILANYSVISCVIFSRKFTGKVKTYFLGKKK